VTSQKPVTIVTVAFGKYKASAYVAHLQLTDHFIRFFFV